MCGSPTAVSYTHLYYTKRDPITNYFPLPNEVFALGLSPGALAVYSYLMYIEDRTTYQCHASYKTIGKAVNMSPNTVRKYVTELASLRQSRHGPCEPPPQPAASLRGRVARNPNGVPQGQMCIRDRPWRIRRW